ncbi:MAG: orotidine-5'-phosphate decarboxylase [Gemmatimonadota bacterium]|nr:orotidine-5'-phosphate decarboxylase [Gemmatimonadota bacterium]
MTARLIVALDYPDADGALAMVERLGEGCDFYKVGLELFVAAGPRIVTLLASRRKEVFLDLKFHDIPNTVRGAARSAASLGAVLVTVHGSGGEAMLAAAVEGAAERCGVLAVTVITSLDGATLGAAWGRDAPVDVTAEVLRLAGSAREAGAHGIVCGGAEAAAVRTRHGKALALLIPGIRPAGAGAHDQSRVVTPRAAVAADATYLVLGRAVTAAADPEAALAEIRAAII